MNRLLKAAGHPDDRGLRSSTVKRFNKLIFVDEDDNSRAPIAKYHYEIPSLGPLDIGQRTRYLYFGTGEPRRLRRC